MSKLLTPTEVVQALMGGKEIEELSPGGSKWYKVRHLGILSVSTLINPDCKFRLAQEMITVGDVSFPKPESTAPEVGTKYYIPYLDSGEPYIYFIWHGIDLDLRMLKSGVVHLTKENAIAHAKALIKLSGGECE